MAQEKDQNMMTETPQNAAAPARYADPAEPAPSGAPEPEAEQELEVPQNARAAIARTDRRRADNYNYYTNQTWGYSDHYDLCIDTRLGREFILDAVREVMKQKEAVEG